VALKKERKAAAGSAGSRPGREGEGDDLLSSDGKPLASRGVRACARSSLRKMLARFARAAAADGEKKKKRVAVS